MLAGMAESIQLAPSADGCRVIYRQALEPRRGCGWVVGLMAKRMSSQLTLALDALKARAAA
jgi:hypothetical protein